ncbi:MAG: nitroreductase family protein [Bacillota bacterium]|nr:nitroreductase family protein [Bacillota bacterium]
MLSVILNRRSIRKYLDKPVEEDKLHQMLESARWAPSGNNTQPWRFILVKSEEMRKKLAQLSHQQKWMVSAPVHLVCIADPSPRYNGRIGPRVNENSPENELKQAIRDTAIAAEHVVLEAENQGLGTCWVAWFVQEEIRPVLNIPEDKYVVAIITIGYPEASSSPTPRRKMEDLVFDESWNQ